MRFVITYPEALAEKVADAATIADNSISLKIGSHTILSDLTGRLRELGFRETEYVYEPRSVCPSWLDSRCLFIFLRTSIQDRLFDDEVDSIRSFNVETQLSEEKLGKSIYFRSSRHRPETKVSAFLSLLTIRHCCFVRVRGIYSTESRLYLKRRFQQPLLSPMKAMTRLWKKWSISEAFIRRFAEMKVVKFGVGTTDSGFVPDASVSFNCGAQALYHKNFELISESFRNFISNGYRIFILSDSPYQAERLKNIFEDRGDEIPLRQLTALFMRDLWIMTARTAFFTDHQIFDRFHKYNLKSDRARSGKLALSLRELNQIEIGDYIVHIDHGIGKFAGLVRTDVNGSPQEMIKLTYQNDDIILVSIHALHKLSKYRGKEGVAPKINKLGSGAWNKLKERTKPRSRILRVI